MITKVNGENPKVRKDIIDRIANLCDGDLDDDRYQRIYDFVKFWGNKEFKNGWSLGYKSGAEEIVARINQVSVGFKRMRKGDAVKKGLIEIRLVPAKKKNGS